MQVQHHSSADCVRVCDSVVNMAASISTISCSSSGCSRRCWNGTRKTQGTTCTSSSSSLFLAPLNTSHPSKYKLLFNDIHTCLKTPFGFMGTPRRRRHHYHHLDVRASYEQIGIFDDDADSAAKDEDETWDYKKYQALLRGGEQVTSVMEEMMELLDDMEMDAQSEELAVEIAAQGVVGRRLESLDATFMMALDFMIGQCQDDVDKRKWLLEVIKDTVLSYLTKKLPPHVQVVGMLCRTPRKESRLELLRRVAGGGGTFNSENAGKVVLPKANLNDIANQADDLLETIEEKPSVSDRRLLARLVLIREEARSMMGGGILDERNNHGLSILPDAEVALISKLVALRPGPTVREKIRNVMRGRDEGADDVQKTTISRRNSTLNQGNQTRKGRPVRPGMFLETISKVLGGMYETNSAGVTVQHLEWVHKETLNILQEIAFDSI